MNELNDNWECFLCTAEYDLSVEPSGYLSNSHPLCEKCANSVLKDEKHKQRFRLTYHSQIGDLKIIANIPIQYGNQTLN